MKRSKKINNSSQQRVDPMPALGSRGLIETENTAGGRPRYLPAERYKQAEKKRETTKYEY